MSGVTTKLGSHRNGPPLTVRADGIFENDLLVILWHLKVLWH